MSNPRFTDHAEWYAAAMDAAEARFAPLSQALAELLEVRPVVDQTGGMVMCLRVPVGNDGRRWVWFSEMPEWDAPGFCCYVVDDEDEFLDGYDGCGEESYIAADMLCPPGEWADAPEFSRAVAEWAAPLIVRFAVDSANL